MIPFVDLKAQYRSIKGEINEAIGRVLESAQFVLGDEVDAFEREFAAYCGARHAVAVNSGTSALHLALLVAGVGPGDEVARRHKIPVVEDAAQAHGAEYNGRRAGSLGDLGCFSFYPGKNLGAYGEGGAVVTDDDSVARTTRTLRDWGAERRYGACRWHGTG